MARTDYLHRVPHGDLASISFEHGHGAVGRVPHDVLPGLGFAPVGLGLFAPRYWIYAPLALHSGG